MACAFAKQATAWGKGTTTYNAMTHQKLIKHQRSKQHKESVAALCKELDMAGDTALPTLHEYELLHAHVKKKPIGPYTNHFNVSQYIGLLPHPTNLQ